MPLTRAELLAAANKLEVGDYFTDTKLVLRLGNEIPWGVDEGAWTYARRLRAAAAAMEEECDDR